MSEPPGSSAAEFVIRAHRGAGVLPRVAALFERRALEIRRLTLDATAEAGGTSIVVCASGERERLTRLAAAIRNLVDVLSVELTVAAP